MAFGSLFGRFLTASANLLAVEADLVLGSLATFGGRGIIGSPHGRIPATIPDLEVT
jgi:hypothetical protein